MLMLWHKYSTSFCFVKFGIRSNIPVKSGKTRGSFSYLILPTSWRINFDSSESVFSSKKKVKDPNEASQSYLLQILLMNMEISQLLVFENMTVQFSHMYVNR